MNLKILRNARPDWQFRAERKGRGWQYIGKQGKRRVRVYLRANLTIDNLGELSNWCVDDGDRNLSLEDWWIEQEDAWAYRESIRRLTLHGAIEERETT